MIRSVAAILCLWVTAGAAPGQELITSASNVRLRSAPGGDAQVVAMLALGTRLQRVTDSEVDGWIPVRMKADGGHEGWVSASLALPVSAATYRDVLMGLVAARLGRQGDGFGAREQLLALLESVLQEDWNAQDAAHLQLQRLRALQAILHVLPFNRALWDDATRAWVAGRAGQIRYNEPGGHWLIRREHILAVHDAHQSAAAADEILWLAVTTGLPGECEGHLVCYLQRVDMAEGEYLRRHPAGRHVEQAAGPVLRVIGYFHESDRNPASPSAGYFDAERDCEALVATVGSLESAVGSSRATQRAQILEQLAGLVARCR